jgi:FkbM family methyltransferase
MAMNDSLREYRRVPWWFELIRHRIANDQRGAWLILKLVRKLGLLNAAAWFPLDGSTILVPLNWPGIHRPDCFEHYEPTAINFFAATINSFPTKATLIDCGADIGMFSRLTMRQTGNLREIILFEPNPASYQVLRHNFAKSTIPSRPINAGVSNYNGFAALENVSPDRNPHAGFIRRAESGIAVTTIDALELPAGTPLALKIDVEGEEMSVLQGAERSLRQASEFIIQLEAAKSVSRRTGQNPNELLRFLQSIRPCQFTCFEENSMAVHHELDLNRPFFEQFPADYHVVDVAARSI